jgi:hypothetical protein
MLTNSSLFFVDLKPGTLIFFLLSKSYSSLSSIRFCKLIYVASLSAEDALSSNLTKEIALLWLFYIYFDCY